MNHTSRFRFKKRIKKRHQSSRRMEFYADVHHNDKKPFARCDDENRKRNDDT
ncbi:hypothetical protein [Psychrobium sp. 1_MG-2023]|uniref:hypothetical protein n=1 Tax=Psychrobium sp. 1_MG-2023 TaxID=3062624 RepID=UPI0026B84F0F|nr:hypothetical protein [Psychrobium sp. 1_MG-2023]MDP2561050.1 hypothetical protein [Psychrobium sp. 1_MG-2023]